MTPSMQHDSLGVDDLLAHAIAPCSAGLLALQGSDDQASSGVTPGEVRHAILGQPSSAVTARRDSSSMTSSPLSNGG